MAEDQKKVKKGTASHNDRKIIFFSVDYDNTLVKRLKNNAQSRANYKFWDIPCTKTHKTVENPTIVFYLRSKTIMNGHRASLRINS